MPRPVAYTDCAMAARRDFACAGAVLQVTTATISREKAQTTFRGVLPAAPLFACINASAQADEGRLEPLYRDLQLSDGGTREKAFQTIQRNADFPKDPETADRLPALLVLQRQVLMQHAAAGLEAEDACRVSGVEPRPFGR